MLPNIIIFVHHFESIIILVNFAWSRLVAIGASRFNALLVDESIALEAAEAHSLAVGELTEGWEQFAPATFGDVIVRIADYANLGDAVLIQTVLQPIQSLTRFILPFSLLIITAYFVLLPALVLPCLELCLFICFIMLLFALLLTVRMQIKLVLFDGI